MRCTHVGWSWNRNRGEGPKGSGPPGSMYTPPRRELMGRSPFCIVPRHHTVIVCCLLGIALQAQSTDNRDLSVQVDEVVRAQVREQNIPGVSLAVMRDGKIIKTAGYGFANLELNVPLSPEMLLKSGSLVKQFTATS